jgi:hypothetical protein
MPDVTTWSAYDDGYLRAHEWAQALAGGASLPQEATAVPLGPGEAAHGHFAPVGISGYFGEDSQYRPSFLLVGGPVGLALTGAASIAHNARKKRQAQRAAVPRWHSLGAADVVVTNQRLAVSANRRTESFWYAETGPLQLLVAKDGAPAVQFQSAHAPTLRFEFAWAPVLYVFVHHLVDRQPPAVPMPPGLLERAKAQGRIG